MCNTSHIFATITMLGNCFPHSIRLKYFSDISIFSENSACVICDAFLAFAILFPIVSFDNGIALSSCQHNNIPQKNAEVQHFFENKSNFFSPLYSLITATKILTSEGIKKNPSQTLVHDGFFSSYSVFGYFSVKMGRLWLLRFCLIQLICF